ncbi:hypothetical protein [Acidimangrovimonas sediminis]|uniref:hypothetical protein n=1 Tax=Acidimangrovimonas sediminis TaxID=2056283 RepID=UPI0011AEFB32|nr:hypothetical protein [Acidimangrovimonas sediminis]
MSAMTIQQMADRVAGLMVARLHVRGRDLSTKIRRGGKRLPRKLRPEAALLADAADRAGNPRLAQQLDEARLAQAYDALVRHLGPLGRSERRTALWRSMITSAAFALLVVLGLFLTVVVWRGLV